MRIRNFKEAKSIISDCSFLIQEPSKYKGKFNKLFDNDNPLHLEIGMGKGSFLLQKALNNPNINYIGVEKYDTIIARAIQKITPYELNNLKIIRIDANELINIFDHELDVIYLNFSDPWSKKKHTKRRLTSETFLTIYDSLFKDKKTIVQKTDNKDLFAFSKESLINYGYHIIEESNDLENLSITNYRTEYEDKFMKKGIKINYLKAVKE